MGRYRLYVDESGDHTFHAYADVGRRYLALVGVALAMDTDEPEALRNRFEELKRRYLRNYDPDEPEILHREDIVQNSRSRGERPIRLPCASFSGWCCRRRRRIIRRFPARAA